MNFAKVVLDDELLAFRDDVRSFMQTYVTPEVLEQERRTGDGYNEGVHLALGERGWLMPDWPADKGGAGLDAVRLAILDLEMTRARVPRVTMGTTSLVVKAVERYAQPELVEELLPGVARGTVRFCLGYTEPHGGSDIASARTRAVRDGDEWVINGSKVFTTGAQQCQYTFLITRTDPELPKHKGLTMFLVPLDTPGIDIQAIRTFGNERTNIVYYDDVRISDRYRLGGVNDGWTVLRGPLDAEHSIGRGTQIFGTTSAGVSFVRALERSLDAAAQWAVTPAASGRAPIDDETVCQRLGRAQMEVDAAHATPGPLGRVKGAEVTVRYSADLMDLVAPLSLVAEGTTDAFAGGEIDFAHRFAQGTVTYGGSVEVFRNIIAQHVLGLPRASYPGSKEFVQKRREPAGTRG